MTVAAPEQKPHSVPASLPLPKWPRALRLRQALAASAVAAVLLLCLTAYHAPYLPAPRGSGVATTQAPPPAPYVYRFSSYNRYFPAVAVSQVSVACLPRGAATVRSAGRLGNLIMEYVSLWTAARLHNLTAFVPADLRTRLDKVFESLDLPEASEFLSRSGCPEDAMEEAYKHLSKVDLDSMPLSSAVARANDQHVPIVLEYCVILPETIVPLADEVRRHFRYQPRLRGYAQDKLRSIRESILDSNPGIKELVFVGVHVRRTDYAKHLIYLYNSSRPADERFYGEAALWLQCKVVPPGGELVLVVASDDLDWVQKVLLPHLRSLGLRHSFLAGDGVQDEPERDMALLSSCNHSVFAYGTFGLSAALLTGGRAVVYDLQHGDAVSPSMQFANHIPGWVAI